MTVFQWQPVGEMLLFREDEFSWQGAHQNDPRVFLRRSKDQPDRLTDMLLGNLGFIAAAELVKNFLAESGGLGSKLVIVSFKAQSDSCDEVIASYDVLIEVARTAAGHLKLSVSDTVMQPSGGYWDAVLNFATSSD